MSVSKAHRNCPGHRAGLFHFGNSPFYPFEPNQRRGRPGHVWQGRVLSFGIPTEATSRRYKQFARKLVLTSMVISDIVLVLFVTPPQAPPRASIGQRDSSSALAAIPARSVGTLLDGSKKHAETG
jgi:hypothetical protein